MYLYLRQVIIIYYNYYIIRSNLYVRKIFFRLHANNNNYTSVFVGYKKKYSRKQFETMKPTNNERIKK